MKILYDISVNTTEEWSCKKNEQNSFGESMMHVSNAGLPKVFWTEAINTTRYLINRSPSTSIDCKTLKEVWLGNPASYAHLRVFGCPFIFMLTMVSLSVKLGKEYFLVMGIG